MDATATTQQPAPEGAGFPPFKTESFPSQIFWLAIGMAFLFVVLWRVVGPRIKSTLRARRGLIQKELETAQENRRRAEAATVAYDAALRGARAGACAGRAIARARGGRGQEGRGRRRRQRRARDRGRRTRLARIRTEAKTHIANAARDAAVEIVSRLTGERISDARRPRPPSARRRKPDMDKIKEILSDPDTWEWVGLIAVVALVIWRQVPAMVSKMLDARAIAIQDELSQAKKLREEAEAVLVRYTERASSARRRRRPSSPRRAKRPSASPRTPRRSSRP